MKTKTRIKQALKFTRNILVNRSSYFKGYDYAQRKTLNKTSHKSDLVEAEESNPLSVSFNNNTKGNGIWKWRHYFDIYHRHFHKFRGRKLKILEIGIYSGGSLKMWRDYFGDHCRIVGIDIEPDCRAYENNYTKVYIGSQSDRAFLRKVIEEEGPFDIIIDDGGHRPNQQRISLEELLPHVTHGGVYLCEDIHGIHHPFSIFCSGLVSALNQKAIASASDLQRIINSVHNYPFIVVIEKNMLPIKKLTLERRGTVWQPFFD